MVKKELITKTNPKEEILNMDDMFSNELAGENDILKELFSSEGIKTRTDLSERQVSIVARLNFMSRYIDHDNLGIMIREFLELRVSKDRKSRKEFVESLKASNDNKGGANVFNRMFGAKE